MPGRVENLKPFTSDQDREAARRNGRKGAARTAQIKRDRREAEAYIISQRLTRPWEYWFIRSTFFNLRPKHRDFIREFVTYGNAAKAARAAGYSHKWAKNVGYRILNRLDVRAGLRCYFAFACCETEPMAYGIVETELGEYVRVW